MIVKMGLSITFVQSSLPPSPVSKISISADIEAKAKKPAIVVPSKNPGSKFNSSALILTCSNNSNK